MTRPLIEALTTRHGLQPVDEAGMDDFLEDSRASGRDAVIFLPGDVARRPEGNDVAVILPELLAAFEGRLAGAVVVPEAEEMLKLRFGVIVFPSLVFMRGDSFLGIIPRIRDWSDYLAEIRTILAGEGAPLPAPVAVNGAATAQQGEAR